MSVTRFLVVAGTGTGAVALAVLLVALTAPTILSASPEAGPTDQTPGRSAAVRPERAAVESGSAATSPSVTGRGRTTRSTAAPSTGTDPADRRTSGPSGSAGREGAPTGTTTSGLPGIGGPGAAVPTALPPLPRPLPAAATEEGELVAGFPRRVLAPLPGSSILTSSVSPSVDRLQVALVADTHRRPEAVLRWFRLHLGRLGLHEVPTRAVAGSEAAGFVLGRTSAVVTVTRPGGAKETTYSVFATLTDRKT